MSSQHNLYIQDLVNSNCEFISDEKLQCFMNRSENLGYWVGKIKLDKIYKDIDISKIEIGRDIFKFTNNDCVYIVFDCAGMNDYIPGDRKLIEKMKINISIPSDKIYKNAEYVRTKLLQLSKEIKLLI